MTEQTEKPSKDPRGWRTRDGAIWPTEEGARRHAMLLQAIHRILPQGFDQRYGITGPVINHSNSPRIRIDQ